jgi:hypothetical protein
VTTIKITLDKEKAPRMTFEAVPSGLKTKSLHRFPSNVIAAID